MRQAVRRPIIRAKPTEQRETTETREEGREHTVRAARRFKANAQDPVVFCAAKDYTSTASNDANVLLELLAHPDALELGATVAAAAEGVPRMLVRAQLRADAPAGTIMINDSVAKQHPMLTRNMLAVKAVRNFSDATAAFELQHVELQFRDQFVSRSDMHEATASLANMPVLVGQEIWVTGYVFVVSRLLRVCGGEHQEVDAGLVTPATNISFESLTFAMSTLFCVSSELDIVMNDGRTAVDWAVDSFMADMSRRFEEFNTNPTITVTIFGAVAENDASAREQYVTTASVRAKHGGVGGIGRELKRQLNLFRSRVQQSLQVAGPGFSCFAPAGRSNFLDAVNVALERFGMHNVDRALHITGHSLVVVTAGKGLFCVSERAAEHTARRMHDIGVRKCVIVCMGRPPAHEAPLFEFDGHDAGLHNQRNLHIDPRRLYYDRPRWIRCLYYFASPRDRVAERRGFGLYARKHWYARFADSHEQHGELAMPAMPRWDGSGLALTRIGSAADDVVSRANSFSRPAARQSTLRLHQKTQSSRLMPASLGTGEPSSYPAFCGTPYRSAAGAQDELSSSVVHDPVLTAKWSSAPLADGTREELPSMLDSDIVSGGVRLSLSLEHAADSLEFVWSPRLATDDAAWERFVNAFSATCHIGTPRFAQVAGKVFRRPLPEACGDLTLTLDTLPVPDFGSLVEEETVSFVAVPSFFDEGPDGERVPMRTFAGLELSQLRCKVCTLCPVWATLFLFQPVNPYTGEPLSTVAVSRCDELLSNEVMANRWAYQIPQRRTADAHEVNWGSVCRCPLMPLRCPAETVIRNTLSFQEHQYNFVRPTAEEAVAVLSEMVMQRLGQGFQIVTQTDTHASLTMGHQTHEITANGATRGDVTVVQLQHRGIWHVTIGARTVHFSRWNYLTKSFENCAAELGSLIGVAHNVRQWSEYDTWVLERAPPLLITALERGVANSGCALPSRRVTYAVVPTKSDRLDAQHLNDFLSRRFSRMLVPASEYSQTKLFSVDDTPLNFALRPSPPEADELIHTVRMEQPHGEDDNGTMQRRRQPPAGGVSSPTLHRERDMYVHVFLNRLCNSRCAFQLSTTWTVCTGSVMADWEGHITVVASDYDLCVVRMPCTGLNTADELDPTPTVKVQWASLDDSPESVIRRLVEECEYFPTAPCMFPGARLVHRSGLCIVLVEADYVAWGENTQGPLGTPAHVELYHAFLKAVVVAGHDK